MKSILKKILILSVLAPFTFMSYGQIEVNSAGNVGIGVTPSTVKLYVSGYTYLTHGKARFSVHNDRIELNHSDSE